MTSLTPHFRLSEFRCRCGCEIPADVEARVRTLAPVLERVRTEFGRALEIQSGYRCAKRNAEVRGAKDSRHLYGDAVDFKVRNGKAYFSGRELADVLERLIAEGVIPEGGVGVYGYAQDMVHYDARGKRARWFYKTAGGKGAVKP